jgi:hypothetical protein
MIYHPLSVLKLIWENISMSAFSRIVFIKTWSCQMMIYLDGEEVTEMEAFRQIYNCEKLLFDFIER